MAKEPTKTERAAGHLAHRLDPRTILGEMAAAVADKVIPQGAAELGQAIFGHGAYVPYGQGQDPIQPLAPGEGVHGPAEAPAPEPDAPLIRETAEHQAAERWFARSAEAEWAAYALRTPAEREGALDRWQGLAKATLAAHAERGAAPPLWAAMNRDEMRAAFRPEAREQTGPDYAGQSIKDRFLEASREPERSRGRGR